MLRWDGRAPLDTRFFDPACWAEYERVNADPATIHGLCEDYRAAATIDLDHHRADRAADRRIACPLLVLWGARNPVWKPYDMLAAWRTEASGPVEGGPVASGHYLAEENPDATAQALESFFTQGGV
jgi:haloacetate dehalogenase